MKPPSQNITESLKGSSTSGRGDYNPSKTGMASGGPSMTVPGDGGVNTAPGAEMTERSVVKAADAMGGIGKMR